jgi:prepilin-type N-terminal cleavage/methylation domain-containing protein
MTGNKGQSGFSLVELLVATAIIAVVIMMSSDAFTVILGQSGQQTKVVNSEIDSIVGLRMLQYDIEHAGYGVPQRFENGINYLETSAAPASNYNDSPTGVPRAIILGNNVAHTLNNSDYLVIKSTIAGTNDAAQKWTHIVKDGDPKVWGSDKLDLTDGDRVLVIKPRSKETSQTELVMDGSSFSTQFDAEDFPSAFSPKTTAERFVIYGVDPSTDLRMPFNRADFYVSRPASNMSPSCAPNTGMLYKATVSHSDGSFAEELPIMDCVADMEVLFRIDTNSDGVADSTTGDISALTAQEITENLKEVRVYILAQEGQRDRSYVHSPATISVGDRDFDLASTIGTGWQNYRWKVYTLWVKPKQLQ